MKKIDSKLKAVSFDDFHGNKVNVGDSVTLLKKCYCFRGIYRAYLIDVTYKGKGRWGYEFDYGIISRHLTRYRIKEPQCVLFKKKGGR